jgi:hypothetical protein
VLAAPPSGGSTVAISRRPSRRLGTLVTIGQSSQSSRADC